MFSLLKSNINKYIVAYASFFFMTGLMGTRPLVPLISSQLGASVGHIGVIVAVYSFFPLLIVVPLGKWLDKNGAKILLILSTLLGSLSLMIPTLLTSLVGVYFCQIFAGISQTVYVLSAQNYIGNHFEGAFRERNIAFFSVGVASGTFLGPLLGGMLSDWIGYPQAFAFLGLSGFFATAFVFLISDGKRREHSDGNPGHGHQQGFRAISQLRHTNLRKAFLIGALTLMAKDLYTAYFPLAASNMGLSVTIIGVMVALHTGAGMVIRWFLPGLVNRFGRSGMVVISTLLAGVLYLFIPVSEQVVILSFISFLLGMSLGVGQPLSISATIDFSQANHVGSILGLRLSCNRLTQGVMPLLFGGIASVFSVTSIFWVVGGVLILGSTQISLSTNRKATSEKG